jgi:hypothetical protein
MALDPVAQRIVLYAGSGSSGTLDDVWQWNGGDWTQVQVPGPQPYLGRTRFAMCSDAAGVLVHGGYHPGLRRDHLAAVRACRLLAARERRVDAAAERPAGAREPPHGRHAAGRAAVRRRRLQPAVRRYMALERRELAAAAAGEQPVATVRPSPRVRREPRVVVLFGGFRFVSGPIGTYLADTWEWDGLNWLQRALASSPPARAAGAMAFSPATNSTLLFGQDAAALRNDTWAWDGVNWQLVPATAASPASRQRSALVFAPGAQGSVLFGGSAAGLVATGDTWRLVETAATTTTFGAGCVGPNALAPTLGAAPGTTPRLGTTLQLRVGNLPAAFTVMLALGLSNTVAAGPPPYSLPFDLGGLGWPGCRQLVALDSVTATAAFAATVDFPFVVPLDAALLAFTFHGQAIVLYQAGAVAVSNGLTAVVGV